MPQFAFVARDRTGTARRGVLEQATYDAAAAALRQRDWLILELKPSSSDDEDNPLAALLPRNWMPVRTVDVEQGLRQLAMMLASGLTLLDSLRLMLEHTDNAALKKVWQGTAERILAGQTMGDAMQHFSCFPPVVVQLARVGEQTGELGDTLTRAAQIMESRRQLKSQIISALAYPIVVCIAAICVAAFMVFKVIPEIQRFLSTLNKDLPPLTQALVDVTDFLNTYYVQTGAVLLVLVASLVGVRYWEPGRLWFDRILLKIPILGGVLQLAATAAWARNLQTLLQSGVSLLTSLTSVEKLLGNDYLALQSAEARDAVVQGSTLADALRQHTSFTPMLGRIVATGEAAGRLDEVLTEAATFYEDLLARRICRLAALVEPAMLLIVGGIVGFVYIAFFMALFAAAR